VVHVPLTYRPRPLEGGESLLLGTMEHSVLGTRWVYDGAGDPVFATTLAATIATGGANAEELLDDGGQVTRRDPAVSVRGSGDDDAGPSGPWEVVDDADVTRLVAGHAELLVVRRVGVAVSYPLTLEARWGDRPAVDVAGLRLS
jgi:hypothetical protein